MNKLIIQQVHKSQGDGGEQIFVKRVKNVIDIVFYSKKVHECYEWFVENQDVIAGLISTLWDAFRSVF